MSIASKLAPNTAKHWLSVLQASGLVWLLDPYHSKLSKRLVKAPKLYFLGTGLAAFLTEWSSPANLEAGAYDGPCRSCACLAGGLIARGVMSGKLIYIK